MARRCYICFKTEDLAYKLHIQNYLHDYIVDRSLNEPISSNDDKYIMQIIRDQYLSDSTVTIFLIGTYSAENLGAYEQRFIKRELQASLYHGIGNTQNGILGIVLPHMYNQVFGASQACNYCGGRHQTIYINDATVVKEFSYNYYIPHGRCAWTEDDRFCVLCRWDDFVNDHESMIEKAFQKRNHPIAEYTRVRPA